MSAAAGTASAGDAVAFWVRAPGAGELRPAALPRRTDDQVLIRTIRSAVSRGTETLVYRGEVPVDQYATMRAPFQDGDFPGPVKYGYLNVGHVDAGPSDLVGRTVFCLYPHQSRYVVPRDAVHPVPADVPAERAVLAGTLETALNALWDAPPLLGDRVAVVGAGMVGCCVARLAAGVPGVSVTLVDVDPSRAAVATALGVGFARPHDAQGDHDLVVHTTATAAGLRTSLDLVTDGTSVLDLSWYGDRDVGVPLGGRFHSGRLGIRASQVGTVAPARAHRYSRADRLRLALDLLADPAYDALLTSSAPLGELPAVMSRLADGERGTICHSVTYDDP